MDVGMMMIYSSYGWEERSDGQMWEEELRLAEIAADSGFDCLWSAEHHFNDYSFVPDNLQLMTHLAARHPDINVGTAAVILPWHNPLRVAENAAVLDLLSGGRLRLGFGRGLARREFEAFGMSMDESRERFDEAAPMIVDALNTGFIEGDGKYYKQARTEIRPRPQHSFDGRIYAVAASDESVLSAAKLGAHIIMFADRPWEMRMLGIERGRALHREFHGTEPPNLLLTEFAICGTDLEQTENEARQYQGKFVESNSLPLRVSWRPLQVCKGLQRLPAEGGHGARGWTRWRGRRLHEGCQLGHTRQDTAGTGRAQGDCGRLRVECRVPLWRHTAGHCGAESEAVCEGSAAGAEGVVVWVLKRDGTASMGTSFSVRQPSPPQCYDAPTCTRIPSGTGTH